MILGVVLCGFVPVMCCMQSMCMRDVGVMPPGLFMVSGIVVLGRFAMMVGGALMVIGGGLVVLATLMRLRAHVTVLLLGCTDAERLLPKSDTRMNARLCRWVEQIPESPPAAGRKAHQRCAFWSDSELPPAFPPLIGGQRTS